MPVADPQFDLPEFTAEEARPAELEELVLTDADRWQPREADSVELVLDDIAAELSPDSRVVRLHDPRAVCSVGPL